ncbi:hypothetical protein DPMN_179321 [Dreissena polymorpha]|uniref:Transmembrane protein n=1 Tax=Dreissena polymorpha TaxID=45954 RepID=A0A9D4INE4_DREPO|nr:hypothetical protein DPMN_179321 [Dreissena polymorpha]
MHAPIWAVSCSGSHCVNTFFVTVNVVTVVVEVVVVVAAAMVVVYGNHFTVLSHRDLDL